MSEVILGAYRAAVFLFNRELGYEHYKIDAYTDGACAACRR